MHYGITLRRRGGEPYWYREAILDGLVPQRVVDLMVANTVDDELGLCRLCDVQGNRCHVILEPSGVKLCPVLFHEVFRPAWRVADVL